MEWTFRVDGNAVIASENGTSRGSLTRIFWDGSLLFLPDLDQVIQLGHGERKAIIGALRGIADRTDVTTNIAETVALRDHPVEKSHRQRLGDTLSALGRDDDALAEYLLNAREKRRRLGESHPIALEAAMLCHTQPQQESPIPLRPDVGVVPGTLSDLGAEYRAARPTPPEQPTAEPVEWCAPVHDASETSSDPDLCHERLPQRALPSTTVPASSTAGSWDACGPQSRAAEPQQQHALAIAPLPSTAGSWASCDFRRSPGDACVMASCDPTTA